jgi:hypothetical protein
MQAVGENFLQQLPTRETKLQNLISKKEKSVFTSAMETHF